MRDRNVVKFQENDTKWVKKSHFNNTLLFFVCTGKEWREVITMQRGTSEVPLMLFWSQCLRNQYSLLEMVCFLLGTALLFETLRYLEKGLLDPIFMILKCELFTHFGSCVLKLHDMSTSQLEALVTWCFLSYIKCTNYVQQPVDPSTAPCQHFSVLCYWSAAFIANFCSCH